MAERIRKSYKFKSVGRKARPEEDVLTPEQDRQGLSFRWPLQPAEGATGRTFEILSDPKTVTRNNLRTLLATNWGERLGEYDFGANLIEFLSDLEAGFDPEVASSRIRETVRFWMPFVDIQEISVVKDEDAPSGIASYNLRVVYEARDVFQGIDAVVVNLRYL